MQLIEIGEPLVERPYKIVRLATQKVLFREFPYLKIGHFFEFFFFYISIFASKQISFFAMVENKDRKKILFIWVNDVVARQF